MAKKSKKNKVDPELYQRIIASGLAAILTRPGVATEQGLPSLQKMMVGETLTDAMISALKEYVNSQKE